MNSPAAQRGQEVRRRLLAAAAELIGERGWSAVSTRVLAERAGVTPSVVHYHFPSVQALLREAVVTGMSAAVAELAVFLDGAHGAGDLVEAMLASVASYSGTDPTSMLFIEAYLAATRDEVLREQIADALGGLRLSLGRRLADRGVADPDGTAAVLLAALDGVLLHRGLGGGVDGQAAAMILRRLVT
ncbi:TetR/AcrR family transcriptional regulator [Mycobacterium sp. CVI_P3]|uniref:TetR/AcrR family transcriptional regulator n=1 Tax=Mycobacterium pinniadriaticum TaxID=2994102 RepID=A0ABT3SNK3_9MYCO|nr:TetR/AcrR family transcriptional regulator [Mycobacterium pinniadriaticum]MCX2934497.1 TetR/AcrR family transcriptional regulator [Mycobacterium pinniadriaticum]MCX2940917.1 TetR/AcrR family transcriptional regulator [Mycobacterium pinniadriaticum]